MPWARELYENPEKDTAADDQNLYALDFFFVFGYARIYAKYYD